MMQGGGGMRSMKMSCSFPYWAKRLGVTSSFGECMPVPLLYSVDSGQPVQGFIYITGEGFVASDELRCRLGHLGPMPASYLSPTRIACTVPNAAEDGKTYIISVSNYGEDWYSDITYPGGDYIPLNVTIIEPDTYAEAMDFQTFIERMYSDKPLLAFAMWVVGVMSATLCFLCVRLMCKCLYGKSIDPKRPKGTLNTREVVLAMPARTSSSTGWAERPVYTGGQEEGETELTELAGPNAGGVIVTD